MTAEAWPTEDAATKAVDAAARKAYEDRVARLRRRIPEKVQAELGPRTEWVDLPPEIALDWREQVLPIVWAALEALPDPRRAAWELGYQQAVADQHGVWLTPEEFATVNPYPES